MNNPLSTTSIQLILDYLQNEGVEYLFGIPGGPLTPLYEALTHHHGLHPILTKREDGAAFMAKGYAWVRQGLGVCCTTTGPGTTNALTGIASAYTDFIPVLLLSAQVATSGLGKGAAQESSQFGVDTINLLQFVTKFSALLRVSPRIVRKSVIGMK